MHGALDGNHIQCKAPPNSGSVYYNYKGNFSIVLLALCDAQYKFTYNNVGAKGSASDGGIFGSCSLGTALENETLNIPPDCPLPYRVQSIPFSIVADDAFPAGKRILKQFSMRNLSSTERIYNYRISRARRTIENAFGIASAR